MSHTRITDKEGKAGWPLFHCDCCGATFKRGKEILFSFTDKFICMGCRDVIFWMVRGHRQQSRLERLERTPLC